MVCKDINKTTKINNTKGIPRAKNSMERDDNKKTEDEISETVCEILNKEKINAKNK